MEAVGDPYWRDKLGRLWRTDIGRGVELQGATDSRWKRPWAEVGPGKVDRLPERDYIPNRYCTAQGKHSEDSWQGQICNKNPERADLWVETTDATRVQQQHKIQVPKEKLCLKDADNRKANSCMRNECQDIVEGSAISKLRFSVNAFCKTAKDFVVHKLRIYRQWLKELSKIITCIAAWISICYHENNSIQMPPKLVPVQIFNTITF
jgi:hypothetical protein